MPTCNETSGGLSTLTQSLFNSCTRSLYNQIGWASFECPPPKPVEYEVEVIDETHVKINGVPYTSTINSEWVDLKEIWIPSAIYLGRQCHMPLLSWEQMMEKYKEGETIFKIQTNG